MIVVENYNRTFGRYPRMSADAGLAQGVWYCGSFRRSSFHGQYPSGFLPRLLALFPGAREILHCPSGTVEGPGITVDRIRDGVRRPMVVADARSLPFRDGSFDLVLADPPYTAADSRKYGCAPFPLRRAMEEWRRVLHVGGHLAVLHTAVPQYSRAKWDLRGLVGVVTGTNRAVRILSVLRRRGDARLPFRCALCRKLSEARCRWWQFQDGDGMVCGGCFGALSRGSRGSKKDVERLVELLLGGRGGRAARSAALERVGARDVLESIPG